MLTLEKFKEDIIRFHSRKGKNYYLTINGETYYNCNGKAVFTGVNHIKNSIRNSLGRLYGYMDFGDDHQIKRDNKEKLLRDFWNDPNVKIHEIEYAQDVKG